MHSLSSYMVHLSQSTTNFSTDQSSELIEYCSDRAQAGIDVIIILRLNIDGSALSLIKELCLVQQERVALFHPAFQQPCSACSTLTANLASLTTQIKSLKQLYTSDALKHTRHIQLVTEQLQDQLATQSDAHELQIKKMTAEHVAEMKKTYEDFEVNDKQRVEQTVEKRASAREQTNETKRAIDRECGHGATLNYAMEVGRKSDSEELMSDSSCSTPKCQPASLKRTGSTASVTTSKPSKPTFTTRRSVSVVISRRTSYNPTPSETRPDVVATDRTPAKESSIESDSSEKVALVPIRLVVSKRANVKKKWQDSESSESDFAPEMDTQFKQCSSARLSLNPSTTKLSITLSESGKAVTADKENINASSTDSDSYITKQPQKTPKKKTETIKPAKTAKPTPLSDTLKAPVFDSSQSTLRK